MLPEPGGEQHRLDPIYRGVVDPFVANIDLGAWE